MSIPTQRDAITYILSRWYSINERGELLRPDSSVAPTHPDQWGYLEYTTRARNHPVHGNWCIAVPVHRLVAYQKYGEAIFNRDLCICHTDNDKRNNSPSNLRLDTPSGNCQDKPKEMRVRCALAAARAQAKLTDADVAYIRSNKMKLKDIQLRYGVSKSCASKVRAGRTYKTDVQARVCPLPTEEMKG